MPYGNSFAVSGGCGLLSGWLLLGTEEDGTEEGGFEGGADEIGEEEEACELGFDEKSLDGVLLELSRDEIRLPGRLSSSEENPILERPLLASEEGARWLEGSFQSDGTPPTMEPLGLCRAKNRSFI